jgi:hypothetical protein
MRYTRATVIALVLVLTVLFNIERLDYGAPNIIDIPTVTYILVTAAVLSVLTMPLLWRQPPLVAVAIWVGVYLLTKFTPQSSAPAFDIYVAVTEVALISLSTWLAHTVARRFADFEEAVENITFTDTSRRVQRIEEAGEEIQTELTRSRRYQVPLSVIVVAPEAGSITAALHRTVREVQQAMMSRYVLIGLARMISYELRRTDLIFERRDDGRLILLCPETNNESAETLVKRIQTAASQQLGVAVSCGAAGFPTEALTFEDLVLRAENNMQPVPQEQPAAVPVFSTPAVLQES